MKEVIIADTSALLSLGMISKLSAFFTTFNVHTTETVIEELKETASIDDSSGTVAQRTLSYKDKVSIHRIRESVTSSRIDKGEGSCLLLTRKQHAAFLITDDLRALPELQKLTEAQVAVSPIVLKAMVNQNIVQKHEAKKLVEKLAQSRDWLGTPIYQRAKQLFQ